MVRTLLSLVALSALAAPALAADLPSLPTLAQNAAPTISDPWQGFYVGTGVSASFAKGLKSAWGGEGFAGYDKTFSNGIVLGVQVDAGYNPWLTPRGAARGFDFAETDVRLGYQMGKLTPFVMTGVALGKETPFATGPQGGAAAVNGLFAAPGELRAAGVVGAGVDYQITDKLKVGVAAYVSNGGGAFAP